MALPIIKDDNQTFQLMQSKWASQLNPLLAKPISSSSTLTSVSLTTGANTINHLLGRKPQGWIISDINASATVYRSQPFNDLTLTLTSSANCTVDLIVF